jgi:hypothetical protein
VTGADEVAILSGVPVGVALELSSGRIYLWGDEWVSGDAAWTSDCETFWLDAFAWLDHRT